MAPAQPYGYLAPLLATHDDAAFQDHLQLPPLENLDQELDHESAISSENKEQIEISKKNLVPASRKVPWQLKCMTLNQLIYERSTGALGSFAFERYLSNKHLRSFQAASSLTFDGGELGLVFSRDSPWQNKGGRKETWAHQAGVTSLAVDKFEGKILISGGSDGTIRIWDLEQRPAFTDNFTYKPVGQITRAKGQWPVENHQLALERTQGHGFGVTHLAFHPWDADTFLSSSYDQTLKICATETAKPYETFNLGAKVYAHATSPIAQNVVVACATQSPQVRLVDLRTKAALQALVAPGQGTGAVLSVAWSPAHEHTLASGSTDGTVRLWDIRRGNALVGLLDQEDSLGYVRRGGDPNGATLAERKIRASALAHSGPVNALSWTDDGRHLVSAGYDRKIRVWNAKDGANTLVNFGPSVRNGGHSGRTMVVSPTGLTPPGSELLFWPNDNEVAVFELHTGAVVTRLRGLGPDSHNVRLGNGAERTSWNRVSCIAYRAGGGYDSSSGLVMGGRDSVGGLYTGHGDGQIRVWMPKKEGRDDEDEREEFVSKESGEERGKKRKVLDDVFRSLTGRQITFS